MLRALLCLITLAASTAAHAQKKQSAGTPSTAAKKTEPEKQEEPPKKEEPKSAEPQTPPAKTATLKPEELRDFSKAPAQMQTLLRYALELTARNLAYKTGSCEPDTGGTDCSGYVYHVLQKHGHTAAPRQSNEMYAWAWRAGTFRAFNGATLNSFELEDLRPGDLMFWTNSTRDGKSDRDPPVTHVMFYLGRRASDGSPVLAGSSDGRTYEGQRMSGVSVFDFRLPSAESPARFIGYAHLPEPPAPKAVGGK